MVGGCLSRRWGTSFLEPQSKVVASLKVAVLKLESWQMLNLTALTANRSSHFLELLPTRTLL